MKPILAALAVAALLVFPETVLTAAQQAMYSWYSSVAPALFPFMALLPLLTCRESARIYERLLGRLTRAVFRLPGAAAPAVVVGMTAGSPAGAIAALRTCIKAVNFKACSFCYHFACDTCGKQIVLCKDTAVSYTKLYHKFFLFVMCNKCYIHCSTLRLYDYLYIFTHYSL